MSPDETLRLPHHPPRIICRTLPYRLPHLYAAYHTGTNDDENVPNVKGVFYHCIGRLNDSHIQQ